MHSRGSPRPGGDQIGNGCLTPTFSGAQQRPELLRNPCILGGSPTPSAGTKSEVVASPMPSRGPKRGWNCYITPAFSGILNKGDKIRSGRLTPAFPVPQKRVELLCIPCVVGGPQQRGQNQKWLPHPCFLRGPKEGEIVTQPLHSRGSPTPSAGTKSELAASPVPSRGAKRGRNCYATRAFSRVPNTKRGDKFRSGHLTPALLGAQKRGKLLRNPSILGDPQQRGQNQKWLPHRCLLAGPIKGRIATQPLHSRGVRNKGDKIKTGYLTPAVLGT